ncbi:hypothetical protein SGPA1_50463 [Streptomyces misionensis JCM 4497]
MDGDALRAGTQPGRGRGAGRPAEPAGVARAGARARRGAARHPPGGSGAPGSQAAQRPDDRGRAARHRLRHLARRRQPEPHHDRADDRHSAVHVAGTTGRPPGRHPGLGRVLAGVAAGVRGRRHGTVRRRQPVHNRLPGGARDPGPRRGARSAPRRRRALSGQGPGRATGPDGAAPHAPGAAGVRRHRVRDGRAVRAPRAPARRPRLGRRRNRYRNRCRNRCRNRQAPPDTDAAHRSRRGAGRHGAGRRGGRLRVRRAHHHRRREHPRRVTARRLAAMAHAAAGRRAGCPARLRRPRMRDGAKRPVLRRYGLHGRPDRRGLRPHPVAVRHPAPGGAADRRPRRSGLCVRGPGRHDQARGGPGRGHRAPALATRHQQVRGGGPLRRRAADPVSRLVVVRGLRARRSGTVAGARAGRVLHSVGAGRRPLRPVLEGHRARSGPRPADEARTRRPDRDRGTAREGGSARRRRRAAAVPRPPDREGRVRGRVRAAVQRAAARGPGNRAGQTDTAGASADRRGHPGGRRRLLRPVRRVGHRGVGGQRQATVAEDDGHGESVRARRVDDVQAGLLLQPLRPAAGTGQPHRSGGLAHLRAGRPRGQDAVLPAARAAGPGRHRGDGRRHGLLPEPGRAQVTCVVSPHDAARRDAP